jgi:calcium-dependent protein kinase
LNGSSTDATDKKTREDSPDKLVRLTSSEQVMDISKFKINPSNFIGEKFGKITAEYNLLSPPVGKGAFGEVRRAIHRKTNMTRAIKIIYKEQTEPDEQERLINEVNVLKGLDHPNIMKVMEFYQDDNHFYIVSEFYNGGELFEKINKNGSFSEKEAAHTIRQILSAVFYCHQHKIVHRDLKPENILFESKKEDSLLKIIDFGTSKFFDPNKKMNQKFGTAYYIAPEVLKRKYNEKCDIWSIGVILYILLSGYPPFNGPDDSTIMDKVSQGKYDFHHEEWKGISDEAKTFIKKMMEYDVKKRYSAQEAYNDPWLRSFSRSDPNSKRLTVAALTKMKSFRAEKKFQEATWAFLVTHMSSREEKAELLKAFQELDTNGDGKLTREELVEGFKKFIGPEDAEKEVDAIMKAVDGNASGAIDYTEFVMATINRKSLLSKEKLEAAFKIFDKDANGHIDKNELKMIFNLGDTQDVHEKVWNDIIREVDQNADGDISFHEFTDMMLKIV